MRLGGIDAERLLKMVPEQLAGGARGFDRRVEVMRHEECTNRIAIRRCQMISPAGSANKKNREEKMNSPPGLKLLVGTTKSFRSSLPD